MSHDGSVDLVSLLVESLFSVGSEQVIKGIESTLGPDDESSELTTRSQLEEVHSVDVAEINSGDVSEGLNHLGVIIGIDEQGSSSLNESSVSHFSFTGSQFLALNDSDDIIIDVESLQESDGILGSFDTFEFIFDDQR